MAYGHGSDCVYQPGEGEGQPATAAVRGHGDGRPGRPVLEGLSLVHVQPARQSVSRVLSLGSLLASVVVCVCVHLHSRMRVPASSLVLH